MRTQPGARQWDQSSGPVFVAAATFGVVLISTALLMRWLEKRDIQQRKQGQGNEPTVDPNLAATLQGNPAASV